MKTFDLVGEITISVYTSVEANTLNEAIDIAMKRSVERYSWNDYNQKNRAWITSEYDGEVCNIYED